MTQILYLKKLIRPYHALKEFNISYFIHLENVKGTRKVIRRHISNQTLSSFHLSLIKVILGIMVCNMQSCFYVKMARDPAINMADNYHLGF